MIKTNDMEFSYSTDIDLYAQFEKKSGSIYIRKCINGKSTSCGNCVGYCQFKGHPGFLTAELRKEHDCIHKKCFYYVSRRNKRKRDFSDNQKSNILELVARYLINYKGIKVVRVDQGQNGILYCFYITITNDYKEIKIEKDLNDRLPYKIKLIRLNYNFDKCVELFLYV